MAIGERHARGKFHPLPSPEESDAALLKRLEMLARKKRERGLLSDGRGEGRAAYGRAPSSLPTGEKLDPG